MGFLRIFTLVLATLAAVPQLGAGSEPSGNDTNLPSTPQEAFKWMTYTSRDRLYSFDYPATYTLDESPNDFGGVDLAAPPESYLLTTMVIPNYLEESIENLYQRLLKQVNKDGWKDIESSQNENWLVISGKRKDDLAYTKFVTNGETNVGYMLLVSTTDSHIDKQSTQALITATVDSFRINWQYAARYLNSHQASRTSPQHRPNPQDSLSAHNKMLPEIINTPLPSPKAGFRQASKLDAEEIFTKVSDSLWVVISSNNNNLAQGSAVAINSNYLLTNCHVLQSDRNLIINSNIRPEPVKVTIHSADKDSDRCVLFSKTELPVYVPIRAYTDLRVGEKVYTIGAPQNLSLTIAEGLLSSKRTLNNIRYLQTSAPISQGSSGGGLFDTYGNLIGITTLMMSNGQNLNFAIPAGDYWEKP